MRIENTGAGIAPEALPFVFERFYKEDRSRGMNTRGSGLGLHICKILINLSGGQIHAESEEGKWCRFVFTLRPGNKTKNRRCENNVCFCTRERFPLGGSCQRPRPLTDEQVCHGNPERAIAANSPLIRRFAHLQSTR